MRVKCAEVMQKSLKEAENFKFESALQNIIDKLKEVNNKNLGKQLSNIVNDMLDL